MDEVARFAGQDRKELFTTAAAKRGNLRAEIVEKDFWVCWTLKRLFTLANPPAGLIFKGGTSLSKAYAAIERFSEDVDLSFDREALGFGGEKDPASAPSKNKAKQWVEDLEKACQEMIRMRFLPMLSEVFSQALGRLPPKDTWGVELDPQEPQAVLFHYPAGIGHRNALGQSYIRPQVRLELGARGEHWPAEEKTIVPYAAEIVPGVFRDPHTQVKALAAGRTFWEKATILHACHHKSLDKPLRERQSRHYYDVAMLYESGIGKKACTDPDLLRKVAQHQVVFFKSGPARYEEAIPGTLRLVPPGARLGELEQDYEKMREMFFEEPPTFQEILAVLNEIERVVNG